MQSEIQPNVYDFLYVKKKKKKKFKIYSPYLACLLHEQNRNTFWGYKKKKKLNISHTFIILNVNSRANFQHYVCNISGHSIIVTFATV
jgi:hypothetical protein